MKSGGWIKLWSFICGMDAVVLLDTTTLFAGLKVLIELLLFLVFDCGGGSSNCRSSTEMGKEVDDDLRELH